MLECHIFCPVVFTFNLALTPPSFWLIDWHHGRCDCLYFYPFGSNISWGSL